MGAIAHIGQEKALALALFSITPLGQRGPWKGPMAGENRQLGRLMWKVYWGKGRE